MPPWCLQPAQWISADSGKAGEFMKALCSRSTLGAGSGKFHTLRGARSDPHEDADFPIATGNKQQKNLLQLLSQEGRMDVRGSDLLPDTTENRTIPIAK